MKLTFLLLFMTTTLIAVQFTTATPVQVVQAFNVDGTVQKANEVARQQTVAAPVNAAAVPVGGEDDDDDDDDDDEDLDILDDDDDDDDEEGTFRSLEFTLFCADLNEKNSN